MVTVHATCIAIDGHGILLRGPSGSGKSDLALRAIGGGARLVADDRVVLTRQGDAVIASAPSSLHGLIEIRGLGIMRMDAATQARIALVADMTDPGSIERLPEQRRCEIEGTEIPWMALSPFEASATAKLRFALAAALDPARLAS
ncbi:MAG TPA: HPr kinase/phosphatase C-terminal domain-containing protein [Alphaproteobacteria bacterium]|jgi:serine kinase of HPr protein (carbohydrate metabolism regulator)|nr:HPr kinase/phosphatase C-terminal domain-containing protein [Alphaproteobacteria bacterium]